MEKLQTPLTLCALLGSGLMAGIFFIFSVCIMRVLAQLPPERGMSVMQSINVVILNPLFLAAFMGTALACLGELGVYFFTRRAPGANYLLAGALIYLIGSLLVTVVVNVPMNDALVAAKPGTPQGNEVWNNYLTVWTLWNHVRTVASLAATACFALALYYRTPN